MGQAEDVRHTPQQVTAAVDLAAAVEHAVMPERRVGAGRFDQLADLFGRKNVFDDREA